MAEGAAYCEYLTPNLSLLWSHSVLCGNTNGRHRTMKCACHVRLSESSHSGGRYGRRLQPQRPMPMKLEAWPGGRWFCDLGGDQTVVAAGEQAAVYVHAGAVYFGAGFGWWGTPLSALCSPGWHFAGYRIIVTSGSDGYYT